LTPTADEETEECSWYADVLEGGLPIGRNGFFTFDDGTESFFEGWETEE
jgi:hypothetical protein